MAKSLNLCQFIGNLGKDPELKVLQNGNSVASISIAVADGYKDKNTGQQVDKTEWVNVSAFGRLAEIIGQYLTKGSKVYISGKFTTRKWQDQNGQDRYTTEIVANEMQMLDSRQDNAGQAPQQGYHNPLAPQAGSEPNKYIGNLKQQAPQQNYQQPPPNQPMGVSQAPQQAPSMNSFDDDIAF